MYVGVSLAFFIGSTPPVCFLLYRFAATNVQARSRLSSNAFLCSAKSIFSRGFPPVGRLPKTRRSSLCFLCGDPIDPLLLGFRPTVGRNHLFSYPPFHVFFRRIPTALCRPLSTLCSFASVRLPFVFDSNIFCSFDSFCTSIIAYFRNLSSVFLKKIKKILKFSKKFFCGCGEGLQIVPNIRFLSTGVYYA